MAGFSMVLVLVNIFMAFGALYTYAERRLIGRFQSRVGPNRVGPFGILQPVADGIKLLTKESMIPDQADKPVYNIAPIIMLIPVILVVAVLPVGEGTFMTDLNIALLFAISITALTTIAIFMAGFSTGNRFAMLGAMRAVAQLISYEVPVVLSTVGIILLTGSLSLVDVVEAQAIPFILVQPLAFLIFIIGGSAEMNRTPFDTVEAESELIAGYHTEYGGMKFAMFQLAEYASVLVNSALITTLFLSGWDGPFSFIPSPVWFLLKMFFMAFCFIWIRATLPRLRMDQVMSFAWKFLLPLSLLNIFVTAFEVLIFGANGIFTQGDLWLMSGINIIVSIIGIVIFSKILEIDSGFNTQFKATV
ncbi:MAG: NADH-quinone oxidoreductase subunit NuoH [SAR202 cluster bacterium]|nr:NADH-quinone oxidoreductase subunit NuoH [Chloroflexota bacterium]MQG50475.1 NADH-quinone oxidoreductase subunit NuoH [SAR202 cluster bacterium]